VVAQAGSQLAGRVAEKEPQEVNLADLFHRAEHEIQRKRCGAGAVVTGCIGHVRCVLPRPHTAH
jgi:hypothetical protein